jgi:hypothetical protein
VTPLHCATTAGTPQLPTSSGSLEAVETLTKAVGTRDVLHRRRRWARDAETVVMLTLASIRRPRDSEPQRTFARVLRRTSTFERLNKQVAKGGAIVAPRTSTAGIALRRGRNANRVRVMVHCT